jgi:arsenate reductase
MAEGILRRLAGDRFEVFSAGTRPKGLHLRTVQVMHEIGIDVSRQTSKDIHKYLGEKFDYVITVCGRARQECPLFPGRDPLHWEFDDPAEVEDERQLNVFRRVRDEIQEHVREFVSSARD